MAKQQQLRSLVAVASDPPPPHELIYHRRMRNEPARVWQTAQALARYLDLSVDEVDAATDRNAIELFQIAGDLEDAT